MGRSRVCRRRGSWVQVGFSFSIPSLDCMGWWGGAAVAVRWAPAFAGDSERGAGDSDRGAGDSDGGRGGFECGVRFVIRKGMGRGFGAAVADGPPARGIRTGARGIRTGARGIRRGARGIRMWGTFRDSERYGTGRRGCGRAVGPRLRGGFGGGRGGFGQGRGGFGKGRGGFGGGRGGFGGGRGDSNVGYVS